MDRLYKDVISSVDNQSSLDILRMLRHFICTFIFDDTFIDSHTDITEESKNFAN